MAADAGTAGGGSAGKGNVTDGGNGHAPGFVWRGHRGFCLPGGKSHSTCQLGRCILAERSRMAHCTCTGAGAAMVVCVGEGRLEESAQDGEGEDDGKGDRRGKWCGPGPPGAER